MSRVLSVALAAFAALSAFASASAQTALPNGFVENAQCVVKASHWEQPPGTSTLSLVSRGREDNPFHYRQHTILSWYYGGAAAIHEMNSMAVSYFINCVSKGSSEQCGMKKDNKVAKAINKMRFGKSLSNGDRKAIDKYFGQKPPASAIRFAANDLGLCFGDDPGQPTIEEIDFVQVTPPEDDCKLYPEMVTQRFIGVSYPEGNHRYYLPWQASFQAQVDAAAVCDRPVWVPRQAVDNLAADRAYKLAHENRPVEERIAGLNGCQIAYGVVTMGLTQQGGVARVPDEGIGWALKYEQAVIDNQLCPFMSSSLSDWVQAQPLTKFEPAPDPFEGFRKRGPYGNSMEDWKSYIARVMGHYETEASPQISLEGDLCADYATFLVEQYYANPGISDPQSKFLFDTAFKLDLSQRTAMCVAVPKWAYASYASKRAVQAARREEANRKMAQREAFFANLKQAADEANKWKPSYRPPPSEPRCYRTGEKVETCFYN
ncbi:MAG: hypothetical protein R3C52_03960 [Hyphomonadaceae bacterium]